MSAYYTKDHEWIKIEDGSALIGITAYAQEQLGDIVFVELPEKGREVFEGELAVVIESVKAAGEVKAPLAGVIDDANDALAEKPDMINQDPLGEGWLMRMTPKEEISSSEWMSEEEYSKYLEGLE